ncbi:MAG: tetratricopeptide repeat protein [Saprospiraceae bacterium]|nr:tetratricopeptide repeat protein [Saprospiraceae bacterium]
MTLKKQLTFQFLDRTPINLFQLLTIVSIVFYFSCKGDKEGHSGTFVDQSPIQQISALISEDSENDSLYILRANLLMESESYDSAIADFLKAISIDSSSRPDYYFGLSQAYLMTAQSKMASDVLDKALDQFPENKAVLLKVAELKLLLKQYMPALAVINKIFERDPQNTEAWYLSGHVLYEMGDTGRAVNAYQKCVDLDPEMRKAWIQLGDVLTELKIERALDYYDNAIRLDSTDPEVYHSKAYAVHRFGNRNKAIALFRQLAARFPSYEAGIYNLGVLYMEADSIEKAADHFSICIQLKPTEASSYYQRALAFIKLGKKEQAKADLENVLSLNADFEEAREALKGLK